MNSFGAYLKGYREAKGIRLEEIASITKIHLQNLVLLESDRWEKLPPDPFLRGFIVAYGKYVGLDAKDLMGRYLEASGHAPVVAEGDASTGTVSQTPSPAPGDLINQEPTLSTKKLVGAVSIAVIVGLLGGIVYLGKRATDQSLKSPTPTRQTATEPSATASATASSELTTTPISNAAPLADAAAAMGVGKNAPAAKAGTPNAATAAPNGTPTHKVSIEGNERTWIKVVVDEGAPIEYFLPQGEKVSYQAKDKIKVVLGNATGAKVFYNGKATEGVNFLGTIRSYKFPAEADFPQDTSSRRVPSSTGDTTSPSHPQ